MRDTSPEADAVARAAIRRRPPIERMREALELSDALRTLVLARLRRRHPTDSPIALVERLTSESLRPVALPGVPRGVPTREHVHTVVRTPNGNDYGKDLLRQHYERHPHPHRH